MGPGPHLRHTLGVGEASGQRGVVNPCGKPCGRGCGTGRDPVENLPAGGHGAVEDTPGRPAYAALTSDNVPPRPVDRRISEVARRGGTRGVRRGTRRRPAPDRLPPRAGPRGHLQGQGVPGCGRRDPAAAGGAGGRGRRGRHAHRAARRRRQLGPGHRRGGAGGAARAAGPARDGARRTAHRTRPGAARPPPRRPALALGLVRRRFADRGDGLHRDRARPRLPRAHRPLAAAQGGPRPEPQPPRHPARRRRRDQRPPLRGDVHVAEGDRGRHPPRRLARPDRRDARRGWTCAWPASTRSSTWTSAR